MRPHWNYSNMMTHIPNSLKNQGTESLLPGISQTLSAASAETIRQVFKINTFYMIAHRCPVYAQSELFLEFFKRYLFHPNLIKFCASFYLNSNPPIQNWQSSINNLTTNVQGLICCLKFIREPDGRSKLRKFICVTVTLYVLWPGPYMMRTLCHSASYFENLSTYRQSRSSITQNWSALMATWLSGSIMILSVGDLACILLCTVGAFVSYILLLLYFGQIVNALQRSCEESQ